MMLVEPRHVRERRLRPQAGCDIQLPEFTAEAPMKRFCSSAEAPSIGIAANCGGASPTGTFRLSSCNGLLMSHSPLTSARPPPIERWFTSPQVAHGGMWIYIDPATAYRDARIGEQFDAHHSSAISRPSTRPRTP
jgi:hypothetical protein